MSATSHAATAVARPADALQGTCHRPRSLRLDHQVDRPHAGTGDHAAGTALQRRQRVAQRIARRVAGAAVVILPLLSITGEGVVGGQINGGHHGTKLVVLANP